MDLVIRAAVLFVFLFIVLRLVGRREMATLEPFDIILLVVMGDLVQQAVTQSDYSVTGAIIVVSTMALLTAALSWVGFRFPRLRPLLQGEPLVLVQNGDPIERNMRRERITVDDVMEEARLQQGVESLDQIRWAVLETNGEISIVPASG
jgi:uncharacterized membrane protein YcaP (DUF421 family)